MAEENKQTTTRDPKSYLFLLRWDESTLTPVEAALKRQLVAIAHLVRDDETAMKAILDALTPIKEIAHQAQLRHMLEINDERGLANKSAYDAVTFLYQDSVVCKAILDEAVRVGAFNWRREGRKLRTRGQCPYKYVKGADGTAQLCRDVHAVSYLLYSIAQHTDIRVRRGFRGVGERLNALGIITKSQLAKIRKHSAALPATVNGQVSDLDFQETSRRTVAQAQGGGIATIGEIIAS